MLLQKNILTHFRNIDNYLKLNLINHILLKFDKSLKSYNI